MGIRPKRSGAREKVPDSSPEVPDNEFLARSSFAKLTAILVHPSEYAGDPRSLSAAQDKLLSLIRHISDPRRRRTISGDFLSTAKAILTDNKHTPSPAMISVARKQGISVEELLYAATRL
jgi:hypothetical protein